MRSLAFYEVYGTMAATFLVVYNLCYHCEDFGLFVKLFVQRDRIWKLIFLDSTTLMSDLQPWDRCGLSVFK